MRKLAVFLVLFAMAVQPALARQSTCLAVAGPPPPGFQVRLLKAAAGSQIRSETDHPPSEARKGRSEAGKEQRSEVPALGSDEVRLTFVGHSTFVIETPEGIRIATDYAGSAGPGALPDVVTMNHAHFSHYTDFPDPAISHVLRGWNPNGGAANHDLKVADVRIRNVPTDIRHWSGTREVDGNSIFIFEVAGLCIGHLGHLHHKLSPQHIGWIGRLDVVMVPVDGTYTMKQQAMVDVLKALRSRIILPMHYFGPFTLRQFVAELDKSFDVQTRQSPVLVVSAKSLPREPTVIVLPGN